MKILIIISFLLSIITVDSSLNCTVNFNDITNIKRVLREIKQKKKIYVDIKPKTLPGGCRSPVTQVLIVLRKLARGYNMIANNLTDQSEMMMIVKNYDLELSKTRTEFEKLRQNSDEQFKNELNKINKEITSLGGKKQALEIQLSKIAERLQNIRKEMCVLKLQNNDLSYAETIFNKMLPKDLPNILAEVIQKAVNYEIIIQFATRIVDFDVRAKALEIIHESMDIDTSVTAVILLESNFWQLTEEITEDNDYLSDVQKKSVENILEKLSYKTKQIYSKWRLEICNSNNEDIRYAMNFMSIEQLEIFAHYFEKSTNSWIFQNCLLDQLHLLHKCTSISAYEVLLNTTKTDQERFLVPIVFKMPKIKEKCALKEDDVSRTSINRYLKQIELLNFTNPNVNSIVECHENFEIFDNDLKTCIKITSKQKIIRWGSFNLIEMTSSECSKFRLSLQELNGTRFKIIEQTTGEPLTRLNHPSEWSIDWNYIGSAYRNKPGIKLNTDDGWFLEANHVNDTIYITNDFDIPVVHRITSYLTRVPHDGTIFPLFYRWEGKHFFRRDDHGNALWKIKCVK
uniref:Putative 62 kDa family member n=1 Tax=Culex tarsalis TaxID=7177 RepID=A0A1Q3FAM4_CULTA